MREPRSRLGNEPMDARGMDSVMDRHAVTAASHRHGVALHAVRLLVIHREGVDVVSSDRHQSVSEAIFAALEMVLDWSVGNGSASLRQVAERALHDRDEGLAATVIDLWNAQQRRPLADGSATIWVLAPAGYVDADEAGSGAPRATDQGISGD